MQDFHLLAKLARFQRARIPARIVHTKGTGAYGTFAVPNDIMRYSKAKMVAAIGDI